MGIQINGQTDTVTSTTAGGSVTVTPLAASTGLNVGTGASISSPATNVLTLGTNNVERVRIDSNGNIGIGTNNPSGATVDIFAGGTTSAFSLLRISNLADGATAGSLCLQKFGSSAASYGPYSANNVGIDAVYTQLNLGTQTGHPLTLYTGNVERARITSSGTLGVNTTSPNSAWKLHVAGATGAGTSTGGALFVSDAAQSSSTNLTAISADTPLGTVSAFFGKNTSVLGLGGDQFSSDIRFNGNDVAWGDISYYPNQGGQGHFRFSTTGTTVNTTPNAKIGVGSLFAASNIGINTAAPIAPLHVNATSSPSVVIGPRFSSAHSLSVGFARTVFMYVDREPEALTWSDGANRDKFFYNSLYVRTPVRDSVNNPAIVIAENGGQASGRNSLVFWNDDANGNSGYIKSRIYTQVGGSYNATAFFIDVADSARNIQNRFSIDVSGNFAGSASNDISDRRLKQNIQTIANPVDKIKALTGRTFEWQERASMAPGTKYGFIAQEVEEVVPELVLNESGIRVFDENDNLVEFPDLENGTTNYSKSVQSSGITPILVEALKEAIARIETLEAEVAELKTKVI